MVGLGLVFIFAFIWVLGAVYYYGERWFLELAERDEERE